MSNVTATVTVITPEIAKEMLSKKAHNRDIKANKVDLYAYQMTNGLWMFNGQSTIISDEGELLDGQHRLSAIVKSGVPCMAVVVRGVKKEAFVTMDVGYGRNFVQMAKMEGKRYVATLQAVLFLLNTIELKLNSRIQIRTDHHKQIHRYNQPAPSNKVETNVRYTAQSLFNQLNQKPYIEEIVTAVDNRKSNKLFGSTAIVPTFIVIGYENGHNVSDMMEFVHKVTNKVGLQENTPEYALATLLDKRIIDVAVMAKYTNVDMVAKIIGAYNCYLQNKPLKTLRAFDAENIPEFVKPQLLAA